MSSLSPAGKRRLVVGLGLVLCVLHYDFWYWSDRTLVLGFLPIGLAYHMAVSIVASVTWAFTIAVAWPDELEQWAGEQQEVERS